VLVMIGSKSVPICNHFHTVRANNAKNRLFRGKGYRTLTPSFEENPITQGHKILSLKTRVLGATHSKDKVILGVLTQCDGRTDGRTDISTMAKTRESLHAVARKNEEW